MATNPDRLRKLADGLTATIAHLLRPQTQNPTPKRNREYSSRLHDGHNAERTQKALYALANAIDAGSLPFELDGVKTKNDVARLVHKGLREGHGCYEYTTDPNYRDTSAAGRLLQQMIENAPADAEQAAAEALRVAESRLFLNPPEGFFPTPPAVIARMLVLADPGPRHTVLEPSAGKGDILAALAAVGCEELAYCEVNPTLRDIIGLRFRPKANRPAFIESDFLAVQPGTIPLSGMYDRILMNPPFENLQDIDHVRHAWRFLARGGRLVSVMSESPFFRSDRKANDFRDWLEQFQITGGSHCEPLPEDSFTGPQSFRQTGCRTRLLVLDKR